MVKAEQILCARCKIKLERQDAVRLDVRLIGSALLLFVILPISVALVINSVNRPVPASVRPPETEPVGQVGSNDGQPMVLFSQKLARKDRRIAALEQELEVTRHRGVREQTIDDLKRTRGEIRNNYRALFKAGLSSQSISERILALMRMAEIGDRSLAELVIPSLEDEAPEVRALAAKLLGVFRTAQASSALLKLLGDDDRLVQESAARALARITGRPLTYFGKRTKDGPIGTQGPGSRDG